MKKHIHFVYDFLFPNGYLDFGYNISTIRDNFLHQVENNSEHRTLLLSAPHNPSVLEEQSGMFADEFISTNQHWNKMLVTEVQNVLDRKNYNETLHHFVVCLESTNATNFFEYYSNPNVDFDDLFSPKLLRYIKTRREFKILMIDNREGAYPHAPKLFVKVKEWLDRHNIKDRNKFIISTCNENIKKIKIGDSRIKVFNNDYYLYAAGKYIKQCEERNNQITEGHNDYEFSLQQELKFDIKEKYFLNYNSTSGRYHRPFLVHKLFLNNLYDKGFISLFQTDDFDDQLSRNHVNEKLNIYPKTIKKWKEALSQWYPSIIDSDKGDEVAMFHNYLSRKDEYEKSYFSIVSETNAETKYLFVTEKTLKPIMNLHPFLVNGNPYTLKHLRSLGFQTFGKWWDESYDLEENFQKRTEMLVEQVKFLCSKTKEEWVEILKEMQPLLKYNQSLLKQKWMSKQYEKNLVDILDTSLI